MKFSNEWLGLLGTLMILIGFCSNSEKIIRIFDAIGSALFVIYGAMIGSISTIVLNGCLILVHCYKLASAKRV